MPDQPYFPAMAIRPILTAPDPRLKAVSAAVESVDAATRKLIDDMVDSMYEADGIGLAAVQIGTPQRVIVMDLDQKDGKKNPRHFINPVITWRSDERAIFEEGCLSGREIWEDVERAARSVKAEYSRPRRQEADSSKPMACSPPAWQHEMDHLGRRAVHRPSVEAQAL